MFWFRLSSFFYSNKLIFLARLIYRYNLYFNKCSIPPTVSIGKNTKLAYGGIGVVINKSVVIGDNCIIGVNVTFVGRSKKSSGKMIIGDNVFIGANSVILGEVNIGDNVIISPLSFVLDDIEKDSIFSGEKAKLFRKLK